MPLGDEFESDEDVEMLLSLERLSDDFTRALNRGGVLKFPLGENVRVVGGGCKGLRGKDRVTTSLDLGFGGRGLALGAEGTVWLSFVSFFFISPALRSTLLLLLLSLE